MAGVPSDSGIFVESDDPTYVSWRASVPKEALAHYLGVTSAIAAIPYVPYATPTPLFFQFARLERAFGVAAMERYFAAASEPKSVMWYDTGHELNDIKALLDRADWLQKQIGFKPIPFFGNRTR